MAKFSDSAFLREAAPEPDAARPAFDKAQLRGIASTGPKIASVTGNGAQHIRDVHFGDDGVPEYVSYIEPTAAIRRFGWLVGETAQGDARIEIADGAYTVVPMSEVEFPKRTTVAERRTEIKEALGTGTRRIRADIHATRDPSPLGPASASDFSFTLSYHALLGRPSEDDVLSFVASKFPSMRVIDADDRQAGLLGLVLHKDGAGGQGDWHDTYRQPGLVNEEIGGAVEVGQAPSGTGAGFGMTDDSNRRAEMGPVVGGEVLETLDPTADLQVDGKHVPYEMMDPRPSQDAYTVEQQQRQREEMRRRQQRQPPAGNVVPVVRGQPIGDNRGQHHATTVTAQATQIGPSNEPSADALQKGQLQKERPVSEVAEALLANIKSRDANVPKMINEMISAYVMRGGLNQTIESRGSLSTPQVLAGAVQFQASTNSSLWQRVSNFVATHGINMSNPARPPNSMPQNQSTTNESPMNLEFNDTSQPYANQSDDLQFTSTKAKASKVAIINSRHQSPLSRIAKSLSTPSLEEQKHEPEERKSPQHEEAPRPSMHQIYASMRCDKIYAEGDYLCMRIVWDSDIFKGVEGAGVRQAVLSYIKGYASQTDRHKDIGWIGKPHFASFDKDAGRALMKVQSSVARNYPQSVHENEGEAENYGQATWSK